MRLVEALKDVKRIAIDTVCVIYFIENHPEYANAVEYVLRLIEQDKLEAQSSVITLAETLVKPLKLKDVKLEDDYRDFLQDRENLPLNPISEIVAERAAILRAKYNLKLADALQIATAILSGCDAFLTNDVGIKRVTEIRVLVLDELELDTTPQ
ncbi:MAG: PIN domain-containing protein [Anaerolinea sp.]|nr:PIN domain-containing protein [Anaerolinea sp.]